MIAIRTIIAIALALGVASSGMARAEASLPQGSLDAPSTLGVWRNHKNSVHLDIRPCGEAACGYVIWSTPAADAAARKGSGKPIVGQQLLSDFVWDKRGYWKGKVFAPDVPITVSGTAEQIGNDTLKARGCLLGKMLCKTQIWTRVK